MGHLEELLLGAVQLRETLVGLGRVSPRAAALPCCQESIQAVLDLSIDSVGWAPLANTQIEKLPSWISKSLEDLLEGSSLLRNGDSLTTPLLEINSTADSSQSPSYQTSTSIGGDEHQSPHGDTKQWRNVRKAVNDTKRDTKPTILLSVISFLCNLVYGPTEEKLGDDYFMLLTMLMIV